MTRKETLFSATLVPRAKHCNTDTMIIVFCRDHGKQRETTTPRKLARSFIESKPILSTQLSVTVQLLYLQWHGHKISSQQHVHRSPFPAASVMQLSACWNLSPQTHFTEHTYQILTSVIPLPRSKVKSTRWVTPKFIDPDTRLSAEVSLTHTHRKKLNLWS